MYYVLVFICEITPEVYLVIFHWEKAGGKDAIYLSDSRWGLFHPTSPVYSANNLILLYLLSIFYMHK